MKILQYTIKKIEFFFTWYKNRAMASSGSSALSTKVLDFIHFPPSIYAAVHPDILHGLSHEHIANLHSILAFYWRVYSEATITSGDLASDILARLGQRMFQHAIEAKDAMEAAAAAAEAAAKAAAAAVEAAEFAAATAMDLADVVMTDAEIVNSESQNSSELQEVDSKAAEEARKATAEGAGGR